MAGDRVDVEALRAVAQGKDSSPEQKAEARRLLAANERLEEAAAELRAAGVEVDTSDFEPADPYACGKETPDGPCVLHRGHTTRCMAITREDNPNDWPDP